MPAMAQTAPAPGVVVGPQANDMPVLTPRQLRAALAKKAAAKKNTGLCNSLKHKRVNKKFGITTVNYGRSLKHRILLNKCSA